MQKCECCNTTENLIKVLINGKETIICKDCFCKQKNVKELGYTIPLGPDNPNANKNIDLYFKILDPDSFANANKFKVSYTYENDTLSLDDWEIRAKSELIASILGVRGDFGKVLELLVNKNEKVCKLWDSLVSITEEEYLT